GREVLRGNTLVAGLNADLRSSGFMLRPDTERVLKDMPDLTISRLELHPTPEVDSLVRREVELYDIINSGGVTSMTASEQAELKGHVATVRRLIGEKKAPQIAEYLKILLAGGLDRLVCFLYHKDVIDTIAERMPAGIRVSKISGSVSMENRDAIIKAFQGKDPRPHILLGQIQSCGVGITLTKARHCVVGELDWTWSVNEQAIKRLHRLTQVNHVQADFLSYPNSIDARIMKRSDDKRVMNLQIYNDDLCA
ncbi:MAG: helicase-related protein, partial [Candidatus Hydrothermarchaeales archaeon]